MDDYDPYGEGYPLDDPKHSAWQDNMLAAVEVMKEKRWEQYDRDKTAGAGSATSLGNAGPEQKGETSALSVPAHTAAGAEGAALTAAPAPPPPAASEETE